jgi:hypothetical protein
LYQREFNKFVATDRYHWLDREGQILVLDSSELLRLTKEATRRGYNYDELSLSDIDLLLRDVRKRWQQVEDESLKKLSDYLRDNWAKFAM